MIIYVLSYLLFETYDVSWSYGGMYYLFLSSSCVKRYLLNINECDESMTSLFLFLSIFQGQRFLSMSSDDSPIGILGMTEKIYFILY